MTETGRVGHLGPQGADIHVDGLTKRHCIEVKSSRRSAKNPGHNVTKLNLVKLHTETARISKEFGVELRSAYAIDIVDAGGVMWAIPEKWFFRYLVAYDAYLFEAEEHGADNEKATAALDTEIKDRILRNCAARHR